METKKLYSVEIDSGGPASYVVADNIHQITKEYPKAEHIKIVTNPCYILSEDYPTSQVHYKHKINEK